MLNQDYISIGRLRQAYKLNGQEAGILIATLERVNGLDLYALWHESVRFVAVEENNKKSIYDEVVEPYFPDTSDMGQGPLEGRILTKRLLRHFLYSARSGEPREYLQRIFNRVLHFTYDDPEEQQALLVNHILDLIYEQRVMGFRGKDKVDISWEYVSPELFTEFCGFFDDTIFANKKAAVLWLFEEGYSQVRSVKGLSMEFARRIVAAASTVQAQTTPAVPASSPSSTAIIVPRALWEGKDSTAAFEALRENKFSDTVIAYVLFHWCNLQNKTEIGRMLIQSPKESSTYLHRVNGLLKKAAALNIIPD